jgi:hypothetical protein
MREFQDAGLISVHRRRITIRDRAGLSARAHARTGGTAGGGADPAFVMPITRGS